MASGAGARGSIQCPLFGCPADLPASQLPTHADVMRSCSQERLRLRFEEKSVKTPFNNTAHIVATNIVALYKKASIPVISHKGVVKRILEYRNKYEKLLKSYNKKTGKFKCSAETVASFKTKGNTLFDVATCQCEPIESCTCEKARKIPEIERPFLIDQRTYRIGMIGGIDAKVTEIMRKRLKRKSEVPGSTHNSQSVAGPSTSFSSSHHTVSQSDSDSDGHVDNEEDEYTPLISKGSSTQKQMRIKLINTAAVSDRFGTSLRETAAISSAALLDYGIITPENQSCIIDKSKIAREKLKIRRDLKQKAKESTKSLLGLYFDGRKDKTLFQVKEGSKYYRRILIQEHVSLVEEPRSQYVGHVSPVSGSAIHIVDSIMNYLKEKNINTDNLKAIGCDGTATNTGHKGGIIRLLELKLNRSLQWIICMFHFNELPFRHLMQLIDGSTSGPTSYSGDIGQQLADCQDLPVTKFKSIKVDLPILDSKKLSKDQQYLYEICQVIKSGDCSMEFSKRDPGPISHARWLTTANRILRLYISTAKPSTNLKVIVTFILNVYASMWFAIKKKHSCKDGSRLLWEYISKTRYLPKKYKTVIDSVIARNAFYAHSENILIAMLGDEQRDVRVLAVSRILKARSEALETPTQPRTFNVPSINFQAKYFQDMIDWKIETIYDPPILRDFSNEQICSFIDDPSQISLYDAFPCHTQAVERVVKEVTTASLSVYGAENRDGLIRTVLKSRQAMPSFDTKNQFRGIDIETDNDSS